MSIRRAFQMDADWRVFKRNPGTPDFVPPPGAVDAHCHVFGPGDRFPYSRQRRYTPCDAPAEELRALRDHLGFERNVIVQASCHGTDNRALIDALEKSDCTARGVAVIDRDISDEALQSMHVAGVRGIRFNFVKRLTDPPSLTSIREIEKRVRKMGWHIVIYFEAVDLPDLQDLITSFETTVVVDHMGRPDVLKSAHGEEFDLFVRLLKENQNIWCKVSCPDRLSRSGPPGYEDVVPFAQRIIENFPDRVLWGTDWPHPNMKSHMPDDGELVDFITAIAPTAELQRKLLVDNPHRLYWPEEEPAHNTTQTVTHQE